tara:strand:+ start:42553 stop:44055 length:1503 start_codon:yes stop_codon:yes gene_type:complete
MMNLLDSVSKLKISIISGLLIGLAYQPWGLGFLSYVGFIPLIHLWTHNGPKINFKLGWVFGIVYNLISNYWIGMNSGTNSVIALLSLFFAVLYLSLFWSTAGYVVGILNNKVNISIGFPFFIVSLEWLRSFGPLGFPWGNLALTQTKYITLIQFVDIFGTYGVTFLVISINVIIYNAMCNREQREILLFLVAILLIGIMISGRSKINSIKPKTASVEIAVIQPNIDPNEKWDSSSRMRTFSFMDSLHNVAIRMEPEFILFPETALPAYIRIDKNIRKKLQDKVDSSKIPILIGTVDRKYGPEGEKIYFNSTIYFQPLKKYEMYSKIHLVPFAEYDLLSSIEHPLSKLNLNIDRGVFQSGREYKVFQLGKFKFSDLICYESSFPHIARNFIKKGADILMIQANDGWLGRSAGPYQHFELARLRAIENRVTIVRSGNTGISGVILPTGKVVKKVNLGQTTVFKEKIHLFKSGSLYNRFGDLFSLLCFIIFIIIGPLKCILKF